VGLNTSNTLLVKQQYVKQCTESPVLLCKPLIYRERISAGSSNTAWGTLVHIVPNRGRGDIRRERERERPQSSDIRFLNNLDNYEGQSLYWLAVIQNTMHHSYKISSAKNEKYYLVIIFYVK
jgi:ribosomal protein L35AE/L33A